MPGSALLRVDQIGKRFGGLVAVDNVSFDVAESEIFGIIGPNGAGKTTLINLVCGFYPPTTGRLSFKDRDITKLKANERAALGIGRNFQASVLFPELSVLENVFTGVHLSYRSSLLSRVLRLPTARREEVELRAKAAGILDRLGLGAHKDELARSLPYGHQRIVGLCMALAIDPTLLVLDEPATGMNRNEMQNLVGRIKDIRDAGVTIVMIEHNMEVVMSACDRVMVLDQGRKTAEGPPEEIQRDERVIEAYLGKE